MAAICSFFEGMVVSLSALLGVEVKQTALCADANYGWTDYVSRWKFLDACFCVSLFFWEKSDKICHKKKGKKQYIILVWKYGKRNES